ncbi:Putative NAD(P)-dependent oxidoreductase EC-YbbO [hydrothermal vent metagenome]|uniref:NAD(P)-dependent oxidoreductase EC-YbbO n=1 Tax=hydrothermal vent metagenome TaxID=652676 RepID=A0A3B0Y765_9ZZZZ
MNKIPKQRSVLITGCSSGIGRCTALALHQRGYKVFASVRDEKDIASLQQAGLFALQIDLSSSLSIERGVEAVLKEGNGLYGLFNNGAYGQPGAVEDLTRDTLRQQFETNVFGWQELTNLIIPVMRRQGYGRIIQNSSVLGIVSMRMRGAYNASKYAIEGLSDTLRLELQGSGVYISLIEPGPITTNFRSNAVLQLRKNIDIENSLHADSYKETIKKLETKGPVAPFTLPPEAVLKRVIDALEKKRPAARYYVTFPTYLFGFLRRILSTRALDRLLIKV